MWLMTKYGFFSMVAAHRDPKTDATPDPNLMMIRARRREHLEALCRHWPALGPIRSTGGTDYPHRVFVPREQAAELMTWLVGEIDYTNFKNAQAATDPADAAYHRFLHRVWAEGVQMEDDRKQT